jgi:PPE-SVP subfamily C-terminal region
VLPQHQPGWVSQRVKAIGGMDFTEKSSLRSFLEVDVEAPGFGKASSLGSLSVPPSWPAAKRVPQPVSDAATKLAAEGKSRGRRFREGLMGMVSGRRDGGDEPKG